MQNHDELAHAGTEWLLADPGQSYIAYAESLGGAELGVTGLPPGTWELLWVDCVDGTTVAETGVHVAAPGDQGFPAPAGIGDECAVWIRRGYRDEGWALAGSFGTPRLDLVGSLQAEDDPIWITLTDGVPDGLTYWIFGLSELSAAFKGGVLVPAPDFIAALPLDGAGGIAFPLPWGPGIPAGIVLYFQHWMPDPGGPAGFAASNGASIATP